MPQVIEWSEVEIHALIDERKRRNVDYHRMFGKSKVTFQDEVAEKVKEDTKIVFTGIQCREKFKNLVRNYKVSKILNVILFIQEKCNKNFHIIIFFYNNNFI